MMLSKKILFVLVSVTLLFVLSRFDQLYANIFSWGAPRLSDTQLKESFKKSFKDKVAWPDKIECGESLCIPEYSFNEELTGYIKKKVRGYHPEYVSVVVLDNNTGGILSAFDYKKSGHKMGKALTFSSTHPPASIFKIITAAELLENSKIERETSFDFIGRSTTLYKYQLREPKSTRWMRHTNFEKAFALSNNVVFGKAAIGNTHATNLYKMATKFGINRDILAEMDLGKATMRVPSSQYELAEVATGFNHKTLISPIHGAMFASIIANKGRFVRPYFVEKVKGHDGKEVVWTPTDETEQIISKESASDLSKMMELTVTGGTARSSFRRFKRSNLYKKLDIGGKTGTITGGIPYGKRDWFVAFASPKKGEVQENDRGISICVMIVNVDKWYIRSPLLAKDIINYYYSNIKKI